MAASGVLYLTIAYGQPPWISLTLAGTFAVYGLIKKKAPLGALEGMSLETLLLAPVAAAALLWGQHSGTLPTQDAHTWLLFALSGPVTAVPLLLFAAGARRLPLATVGLLQYLSPSLQLVLGIWVFHEPFDVQRLIGFAFIWAGLALVSADALGLRRWRPATPPPV